jgi:hypothetical protein
MQAHVNNVEIGKPSPPTKISRPKTGKKTLSCIEKVNKSLLGDTSRVLVICLENDL